MHVTEPGMMRAERSKNISDMDCMILLSAGHSNGEVALLRDLLVAAEAVFQLSGNALQTSSYLN